MKKICIFINNICKKFKKLFKKSDNYYIELSEIEDISNFNLEKNNNIFQKKNTYKPPELIESKMSDSFSLSDDENIN